MLIGTALTVDSARISASATRIQYGDSVTLTWVLDGARDAYISNLGRVRADGSRRLAPEVSTTYALVGENGVLDSVTVEVYGSRTGDRYPDPEQFNHAVQGSRRAVSGPEFLERTRSYLQDSLRLAVRDGPLADGGYRFITFPSERVTSTGPLPRQFRARRTSFMVEVAPLRPGAALGFTVMTYVEYQRRGEESWRQERDVEIYLAAARTLKNALER
jgi:hypothetical protein